jgi:hypothetical protein
VPGTTKEISKPSSTQARPMKNQREAANQKQENIAPPMLPKTPAETSEAENNRGGKKTRLNTVLGEKSQPDKRQDTDEQRKQSTLDRAGDRYAGTQGIDPGL